MFSSKQQNERRSFSSLVLQQGTGKCFVATGMWSSVDPSKWNTDCSIACDFWKNWVFFSGLLASGRIQNKLFFLPKLRPNSPPKHLKFKAGQMKGSSKIWEKSSLLYVNISGEIFNSNFCTIRWKPQKSWHKESVQKATQVNIWRHWYVRQRNLLGHWTTKMQGKFTAN